MAPASCSQMWPVMATCGHMQTHSRSAALPWLSSCAEYRKRLLRAPSIIQGFTTSKECTPHRSTILPVGALRGTGARQDERRGSLDDNDARFMAWAEDAGVRAPKLQPADFRGIRGMQGREAIAPDESFVSLPRGAALVVTPKIKCPFPEFVDPSFWSAKPWFVKLALMVLHERQAGASSPVAGYVMQLPVSFQTPLHWTLEERSHLQYPHLESEVGQSVEGDSRWIPAVLTEAGALTLGSTGSSSRSMPSAIQGTAGMAQGAVQLGVAEQEGKWAELHVDLMTSSPHCGVSLDDLTWAMECVLSRAFSGPYSGSGFQSRLKVAGAIAVLGLIYTLVKHVPTEQVLNGAIAAVLFNIIYDTILSQKLKWYALCPVIDSMNHRSSIQSAVAYEYFRDTFSVSTASAVKQGEEVLISYGQQSNDRLLQFYGFVEPSNPADSYVMTSLLTRLQGVLGQDLSCKLKMLEAAGLSEALQKATLMRSGPDAATMATLRAVLAPAETVVPGSAPGFQAEGAPASELLLYQVLVSVLEAEVVSMPTSRKDDQAALSSGSLMGRSQTAAQFRVEKKGVLAACLEAARRQRNVVKQKLAE